MYLNTQLKNSLSVTSPVETITLEYLETATNREACRTIGHFNHLLLHSHFQPIYSFTHQRAVGYEALLRAKDQNLQAISPLAVFEQAKNERDTVFLDRLSRDIHIRNFAHLADDKSWLFLNISPLVTISSRKYGRFFKELLEKYQFPPHRVVIEILEGSIADESLLLEASQYYRELGCLVAIDDFGAGHSNFDRIWRLEPEIVKLDRSIIKQAADTRKIRRILPNLISLIHESGSLSLIEGVETEEQALIAMDSGADFIQGYYFGKPQAQLSEQKSSRQCINQLAEKLKYSNENTSKHYRCYLEPQIKLLKQTAELLENNMPTSRASLLLLQQSLVKRSYILDHLGKQVGPTLTSCHFRLPQDPRLTPLQDAEDATWSQRSYFHQAIENLSQVQISKPYLSIADANICITLSISFYFQGQIRVLCCDLDWDQLQKMEPTDWNLIP